MFRIVPLVENTTSTAYYKCKHGLCIYVQTDNHKILFDVGPNSLFLDNAKKMGVDIADIDTVIISHGHSDHGGGLRDFIEMNTKAKIFIRKNAFEPHYIKVLGLPVYVGLDSSLVNSDRFVFTGNVSVIDEELLLFSGVKEETYFSKSNKKLFAKKQGTMIRDDFEHEQNLIITAQNKRILISGCSHCGIVNIQKKAEEIISDKIDAVVGGFHLFNPPTKKYESDEYIGLTANAINKTGSSYYTCHCTGVKAYEKMKPILGCKLHYLGTGAEFRDEDI